METMDIKEIQQSKQSKDVLTNLTHIKYDKIYELLNDDNLTFLGSMKQLIFIITKTNCSQCGILKESLNLKKINYIEIPHELLTKQTLNDIYTMRKSEGISSLTFPILLVSMENYFLF